MGFRRSDEVTTMPMHARESSRNLHTHERKFTRRKRFDTMHGAIT